jgi:hypothetical protein
MLKASFQSNCSSAASGVNLSVTLIKYITPEAHKRIRAFYATAFERPQGRLSQAPPLLAETACVWSILQQRRTLTASAYLRMASDEDYLAFLDKANKDPSEGVAKSASSQRQEFKATDSGAQVPAILESAIKGAYYSSDADEPFLPVCLKWDEGGKGLPDEGMLSSPASFSVLSCLNCPRLRLTLRKQQCRGICQLDLAP